MRILPPSLWLLVAAQIEAAQAQAQQQLPTAIRKMPPDQGEKLYHEYCAFPMDMDNHNHHMGAPMPAPKAAMAARRLSLAAANAASTNSSMSYRPPRGGVRNGGGNIFRRRGAAAAAAAEEALARLERRDWSCPAGTSSCASIGYPNSCCQTGETCTEIVDTGLGSVGCCPAGATCGGAISGCATGNTACASDLGGGCCIPGFVCQGVGCVSTTAISPSSPVPIPTGLTTLTSTSTSVIVTGPAPSTVVVTVVITITPSQSSPASISTTTTQTISAPSSSSSSSTTTTTNSSGGILPPIRPTSSDDTAATNTYCPTGFYACLASAGGGCCQTGRDCQTTSCPPVAMTTMVDTNGVTVVVPASEVPATATATCASGWFMCGSEAGPVAGCCPSGYSCGTASCSVVTVGGTATIAKELPGQTGGAAGGRGPIEGLLWWAFWWLGWGSFFEGVGCVFMKKRWKHCLEFYGDGVMDHA
ncbi:hypothetical protein B0T17DRAFT_650536 [Bombardia bombarda]|uniref:GPI anchored protein n=1 Tax=Bombardia bombarda TaxID=252184 RepID=A0AA39XK90_9PEZI|nr:hypothetical protein B0T17DRAFT_650536 [Bombardia bombarda]